MNVLNAQKIQDITTLIHSHYVQESMTDTSITDKRLKAVLRSQVTGMATVASSCTILAE